MLNKQVTNKIGGPNTKQSYSPPLGGLGRNNFAPIRKDSQTFPNKNSKNAPPIKGKGSFSKNKKKNFKMKGALSLSQLLSRLKRIKNPSLNSQKNETNSTYWQTQKNFSFGSSNKKSLKPIIPPKSLVIILKEKPEKAVYNRRIIDYKHCGLLQRFIGLGGKILPRRQTRLTAKQQRYIARTIKTARIMGLLPFVSKEKGFFR